MKYPTAEQIREAEWATCAMNGHRPTEAPRRVSQQFPTWTCDCRTVTWEPRERA